MVGHRRIRKGFFCIGDDNDDDGEDINDDNDDGDSARMRRDNDQVKEQGGMETDNESGKRCKVRLRIEDNFFFFFKTPIIVSAFYSVHEVHISTS